MEIIFDVPAIIVTCVLFVVIGGMIWARSLEKREWNNGRCSYCGTGWKFRDMDSQGSRFYKCSCCDRSIWISYPFVDKVGKYA